MNKTTIAVRALGFSAIIGLVTGMLLLLFIRSEEHLWIPQVVVTLVGLVGASWFAGHRLDLLVRDIEQRHDDAKANLSVSEQSNFNTAINEATKMMSDSTSLSVSIAGQRWLHTRAEIGNQEASLVQVLLCNHIRNFRFDNPSKEDFCTRSIQEALFLLFSPEYRTRFDTCEGRSKSQRYEMGRFGLQQSECFWSEFLRWRLHRI